MNQGTVATMGAASLSPASSPNPSTTSSHAPSPRMRLSLSMLQSLAMDGKVQLTAKEVEFFKQKGYLRPTPSSSSEGSASTSNIAASSPSSSVTSTTSSNTNIVVAQVSISSPAATPRTPASPSMGMGLYSTFAKPPLPVAERLAPMSPAALALRRQSAESLPKSPIRPREIKRPSQSFSSPKQSIAPFHNQVFEDTCSHLHLDSSSSVPSLLDADELSGFRRHSESSSSITSSFAHTASARVMQPVPENGSVQFDSAHLRRASIATTTPVVSSPLGLRTVLYAASSPSHTLLSLPVSNYVVERPLGALPSHTAAMNNFKFPATSATSTGSLSPSPVMAHSPAPPTPTRSKRKSVPRRSPSGVESQDQAPGIIFQFPFGTPPMPSTSSPRRAATPASHPSPSGGELITPPSPASRAGLGIQCHSDSFSEPDATHPFEQARPSTPAVVLHPHQDLFSDKSNTMTVGDIIVAEEESAARQAATAAAASHVTPSAMETESAIDGQDTMPSPPETATVVSRDMIQNPSATPATTPSPTMVNDDEDAQTSQQDQRAQDMDSNMIAISLAQPSNETLTKLAVIPQEGGANASMLANKESGRTSRASSAPTPSTTAAGLSVIQEEQVEGQEDPSHLPLWAQRQNRIRRQSLIPRPDLNFVSGSGILPPDNKDLSTRGGATILSYPVLLSDVLQVRIDELEAKLAADGALFPPMEEEIEVTETAADQQSQQQQQQHHHQHGKRKKGGAGSKKSNGTLVYEDTGMFSDSEQRNGGGRRKSLLHQSKRRRSSATLTPEDQDELVNPTRVVPERHGASIYRRGERHHHHHRRSSSPSSSPSPPARRGKNLLGSPVKLGNVSHSGTFEDDAMEVENDDDDEDYDDGYRVHKNRHQSGGRSSQARHVLEIPPNDVEIAMQHTRDMLDRQPRNRRNSHHHESHLRSLQPLLDAIQSENDGEVDEDESMDEGDDDEEEQQQAMEQIESKAKGKASKPKVSHKKGAAAVTAAANGGSRKRKADDQNLGTPVKKEKAGSSKAKTTKALKKRVNGHDVTRPSLESLATASMLVDLHSGGSAESIANGGETVRKISKKAKATVSGQSSTSGAPSSSKPKTKAPAGPSTVASSGLGGSGRKHCEACGAEETPCWRPGYDSSSVLCNSCGLRYKKSGVYCTAVGCKYIPLKAEFAAMEDDRKKNGREHLQCFQCRRPVAPPSAPPIASAAVSAS